MVNTCQQIHSRGITVWHVLIVTNIKPFHNKRYGSYTVLIFTPLFDCSRMIKYLTKSKESHLCLYAV
jgi:hypothetical protein